MLLGTRRALLGRKGQNAANGLLNNLIAYWPGNEANGNALDMHTNALHLTDANTVTSAAGLVYATARQYTQVNVERSVRPGDDELLSVGDVDFTIATWAYLDSKAGAAQGLVSKDALTSHREYYLGFNAATDRLRLRVFDGANQIGLIEADTLGSPALATWYLIVAWHDAVANTVNIQVNGGAVNSAATTGAPGNAAAAFAIGGIIVDAAYCANGRIGPTAFWKSLPGGGGVLSEAQRTALWNGGAGLAYAAFTN